MLWNKKKKKKKKKLFEQTAAVQMLQVPLCVDVILKDATDTTHVFWTTFLAQNNNYRC